MKVIKSWLCIISVVFHTYFNVFLYFQICSLPQKGRCFGYLSTWNWSVIFFVFFLLNYLCFSGQHVRINDPYVNHNSGKFKFVLKIHTNTPHTNTHSLPKSVSCAHISRYLALISPLSSTYWVLNRQISLTIVKLCCEFGESNKNLTKDVFDTYINDFLFFSTCRLIQKSRSIWHLSMSKSSYKTISIFFWSIDFFPICMQKITLSSLHSFSQLSLVDKFWFTNKDFNDFLYFQRNLFQKSRLIWDLSMLKSSLKKITIFFCNFDFFPICMQKIARSSSHCFSQLSLKNKVRSTSKQASKQPTNQPTKSIFLVYWYIGWIRWFTFCQLL